MLLGELISLDPLIYDDTLFTCSVEPEFLPLQKQLKLVVIGGDYPQVEGVSIHAIFVEVVEVVFGIEVAGFEEGVIHVHAFHCIVSPLDILKRSRIKRKSTG